MSGTSSVLIDTAFADVPSIQTSIRKALVATPQYARLFDDISKYVLSLRSTENGIDVIPSDPSQSPSKKRRLDEPQQNGSPSHSSTNQPRRLLLEAREISFTLPQRKKFHLGLVQYGSTLDEKNSSFAIQGRNPASNQVEFEYPIANFAYASRLPVPEKNQKQYNFCLLPTTEKLAAIEPIIWTVNHGPLKSCKVEDEELAKIAPGPEDILENSLKYILAKTDIKFTLPDEKEFASALRESHRKNDIAYHVKAHRGSKEGYLFFLENGIFFGFKKPLSFFSFAEIDSISYTSVLQRTFNLNFTIRSTADASPQEIEFSMLDQQDFAGIDTYIKDHGLQDASLAEARRAKKTGKAAKNEVQDDEENDGRTELEKAQQELEDEEDEMEEDYDPEEDDDDDGSESGSASDDGEYTRGKGRNLVADELGSEAEDVSASEDGEDKEEEAQDDEEEEEEDDVQPVPVTVSSRPAPRPVDEPDLDDEDQL